MKKLIEHIYKKKGRIYKNQRMGSGRLVFALGKGFNGEVGADLTLYKSTEGLSKMYTLILPDVRKSYTR